MPLEFKDIKDWTPASISIVDAPAHPLAVFEVYENDDEFIKKFKQYSHNEVNNMSENNNEVKMPSSVFERIFGSVVMKSDNTIDEKPKDEIENIKTELAQAQKEITTLQETIKTLQEKLDEKEDNNDGSQKENNQDIEEIVENTVKRYLEEKDSDDEQEDNSQDEKDISKDEKDSEEPILDDEKFIKKSKSIDPDNLKHSKSEKTFMERIGRTNDGMNW